MDRRPTLAPAERMRLFHLHDETCHICSRPIQVGDPWEIEHIISRGMIGKAADVDSNMKPAHTKCHRAKTAVDADELARAKRREAKHKGAWRPRSIMPGSRASGFRRGLDGRVQRRTSHSHSAGVL